MKIVLATKPHRCCGRCGITPYEARKDKVKCIYYGVEYKRHVWILWTPDEILTNDD